MKNFDLKSFLSDNREQVIASYNECSEHKFFDGISLKEFMMEVMVTMQNNRIASEKRASFLLPNVVGCVFVNHSRIQVRNDRDAQMENKYKGTAYMALV